jgi:hypothetical protein
MLPTAFGDVIKQINFDWYHLAQKSRIQVCRAFGSPEALEWRYSISGRLQTAASTILRINEVERKFAMRHRDGWLDAGEAGCLPGNWPGHPVVSPRRHFSPLRVNSMNMFSSSEPGKWLKAGRPGFNSQQGHGYSLRHGHGIKPHN